MARSGPQVAHRHDVVSWKVTPNRFCQICACMGLFFGRNAGLFAQTEGVTMRCFTRSRRSPLLLSNEKAEGGAFSVRYVPLRAAFRYRPGQCRGMLASCASFKLRATAQIHLDQLWNRELLYGTAKSQLTQTLLYSCHHRDRLGTAQQRCAAAAQR
jgi:hypothetical protein